MKEQLKNFFDELKNNIHFKEKFSQAKTAEEGYILAKPYIGGASLSEFKDGLRTFYSDIRSSGKNIISKEEIKKVSGGVDVIWNNILELL